MESNLRRFLGSVNCTGIGAFRKWSQSYSDVDFARLCTDKFGGQGMATAYRVRPGTQPTAKRKTLRTPQQLKYLP